MYNGLNEFLEDMEQVFENCRVYNGVESPVGQMGIRVKNEYKSLLNTYRLVERFCDEKEAHKFQLDDSCFETKPEAPKIYREEISDSEVPADGIKRMNEQGEINLEHNNGNSSSAHVRPEAD